MDVITELRPKLRDDAGKKCCHLVEIGIVRRVAVDPLEPNAPEELVDPGAHGLVVNEAHIGQHMREAGLAGIPVWRHRAGGERSILSFIRAHSYRCACGDVGYRRAAAGFANSSRLEPRTKTRNRFHISYAAAISRRMIWEKWALEALTICVCPCCGVDFAQVPAQRRCGSTVSK